VRSKMDPSKLIRQHCRDRETHLRQRLQPLRLSLPWLISQLKFTDVRPLPSGSRAAIGPEAHIGCRDLARLPKSPYRIGMQEIWFIDATQPAAGPTQPRLLSCSYQIWKDGRRLLRYELHPDNPDPHLHVEAPDLDKHKHIYVPKPTDDILIFEAFLMTCQEFA